MFSQNIKEHDPSVGVKGGHDFYQAELEKQESRQDDSNTSQ